MKLWRRKRGIVGLLLLAAALCSFFLGEVVTLTEIQMAGLGILLLLLVLLLVPVLVRRKLSERELIEEQDERNQFLALKRAALNLEVVKYALFLTVVCGIIGFGLTKEYTFLFLAIGAGIPYGILRISCIVNLFRYD